MVQAQFLLDGQTPQPALRVVAGEVTEGLNQLTRISLCMAGPHQALAPGNYLGKPATLTLSGQLPLETLVNRYDGVVVSFGSMDTAQSRSEGRRYLVEIRSKAWVLGQNRQNRVLTGFSAPQAAQEVLTKGGLSQNTDFKLKLLSPSAYPTLEQQVQYEASDWQFVEDTLRGAGVYYFLDCPSDGSAAECLIMADDSSFYASVLGQPLNYVPSSGLAEAGRRVGRFQTGDRLLPQKLTVQLHQTLYPHQSHQKQQDAASSGQGLVQYFGLSGPSQAQADLWAKSGGTELAATALRAWGQGNYYALRSGRKFTLSPDPGGQGEYVALTVIHRFSQQEQYAAAGQEELMYDNEFTAGLASLTHRPPMWGEPLGAWTEQVGEM